MGRGSQSRGNKRKENEINYGKVYRESKKKLTRTRLGTCPLDWASLDVSGNCDL